MKNSRRLWFYAALWLAIALITDFTGHKPSVSFLVAIAISNMYVIGGAIVNTIESK